MPRTRIAYLLSLVVLLSVLLPIPGRASTPGLKRWDAMPAIDVLHVAGPYAGQRVCPMCRHGYDAGLLVFLPSSMAPSQLDGIMDRLDDATTHVSDPRFRRFVLLTGRRPDESRLGLFADRRHDWFAGWLEQENIDDASRDYRQPLREARLAYVFGQRRALQSFDPATADGALLGALADYSLQFLQANTNAGRDQDAQGHGRMWTAPATLHGHADLGAASDATSGQLCIRSNGTRASNALIALHQPEKPRRVTWVRSNPMGCFTLENVHASAEISAELFRVLQPHASFSVQASRLTTDQTTIIELADPPASAADTPIVGLPCEGCELVFRDMPADIGPEGYIAPASESGERLHLSGIVSTRSGAPASNILVYAYQTDAGGLYPEAVFSDGSRNRHGRLRAWARTDGQGRYAFHSVRPGAYPGRRAPQHVHMHVIEPGRCTYYIGDVLFSDDPHFARNLIDVVHARGGSGLVTPQRHDGTWMARRDIRLGEQVPGYESCRPGQR